MRAVEFHVTFKNQPLSKAKVHIETVSGWSRELVSDEQGKFSIVLPWNSAYVLEVDHNDPAPGERAGEKYDVANYRTTLSLQQAKGLASPPAPPAAKPSR